MEVISTSRKGRKLLVDGYAYTVDRKRAGVIHWRCERRGGCGGRIRTDEHGIQGEGTKHSHPPDVSRNLAMRTVSNIRERAKNSDELTSNIIKDCTSEFPLDVVGNLPKKESLSRMIRRHRIAQDENASTADVKKPVREEEDFVIHESENLLVLSAPQNLNLLALKKHWLFDGTFDTAHLGFHLYTIHAMMDKGQTIPLVYCITKRKDHTTYDMIFNTLKEVTPDLNPVSVTIDFEKAALNSIRACFPNTNIYGCFLHFGQSLWKQIIDCGLETWYNESENALIIKSIQALAFVPVNDVAECFNEILSSLSDETDDLLSEFLGYFESTWIGVIQRGKRRRPQYEISMWNTVERTIQGLPWTTNSLDVWHKGFEQRLSSTHPTISRVMSQLREEQSYWELEIEMARSGGELNKSKEHFEVLNEKMKTIIKKYDEYSKLDFLKEIANNL